MKKIISLILIMTFLFTYPIFSIAEEDASSDISLPSACELLRTIGIMDVNEDNYEDSVTRQEFAKILFKLITNSDLYPEDYPVSVYPDVIDNEYIGYVNEMARLNIINGYSDGKFRPFNEITLQEAVTCIIRAVGYDVRAEVNGGYPTGYLYEAQNTGILKGVSSDSFTHAECAKLIKNTLLAKFQSKSGFKSDGSVSYTDSTYTILKSVYRIEVIKDVVNGIDMTKLSGESTVPPWHILIGEKTLDIGALEPRDFLGMEVEAYYTIDDDILVHIEKTNRNNITVVDVKDLHSIDTASNIITKREYTKNTEYKYGILTDFIYNFGISENPFTLNLFEGKRGTLTLIDNNSDRIYDVVKADVYFDIVCDYVDISSKLVYDIITGQSYSLDTTTDNPYVDIFDGNGNVVDMEDINKYDVLSVYETLPEHEQKYSKFIVSRDVVSGNITETGYDDDGRLIAVINGAEYIFTDTALNYYGASFDAGKKYIFSLNNEGYIAAVKENVSEIMVFGVIINYYIEENPLERNIYLVYMTQGGKKLTTGLRKWVTIDNQRYKNDDLNLLKHLDKTSDVDFGENAVCNGTQVIKYQLDANGNFAYIDTVAESYDYRTDTVIVANEYSEADTYNCLRKGHSNSEMSSDTVYLWNAKSYDGKVFVSSNTKAFIGPYRNLRDISIYKDSGNYKTGTLGGAYDHYSSYYDDPDSYLASLVFLHRVYSVSDGASGYDITFSIFDKYTNAVNSEGEKGYMIYYWQGKSYKSAFASASAGWRDSSNKLGEGKIKITPDKLKQGDVLRFSTKSDGSIANYKLCYRADGDILVSVYDTGNWYSSEKMFAGYLFRKYNDGVSFVRIENPNEITLDSEVLYIMTGVPVMLYDPDEREGKKLTVNDFNSGEYFLTDGTDASRVIVNTKSGNPYAVYIIKR